ncbi:hypothetical protein [Haloglycomyces albus]|uniref:hypothetical protein n=1 Tax=Haloglycomyces albus TaxID=526067 RepID=UPI0012EC1C9D|nr:hypothetical protein [Haloglycomyces albus]
MRLSVVATTVFVLSGCSMGGGDSDTPTVESALAQLKSTYEATNELHSMILSAERDCLEAAGFAVHPYSDRQVEVEFQLENLVPFQMHRSPSVEDAGKYGYVFSEEAIQQYEKDHPVDPESEVESESLPPRAQEQQGKFDELPMTDQIAYYDAWWGEGAGERYLEGSTSSGGLYSDEQIEEGDSTGGCERLVSNYLFGEDGENKEVERVFRIFGEAVEDSFIENEDNQLAIEEWASCMDDRGFKSIQHPKDTIYEVRNMYSDGRPALTKPDELDMAKADSECAEKLQTNEKREDALDSAIREAVVEMESELYGAQQQAMELRDKLESIEDSSYWNDVE